jgi:hypothetical protein
VLGETLFHSRAKSPARPNGRPFAATRDWRGTPASLVTIIASAPRTPCLLVEE